MIIERTVYDVKCSGCWKTIASGFSHREDAEIDEKTSSLVVNGVEHAFCAACRRELCKKVEAKP